MANNLAHANIASEPCDRSGFLDVTVKPPCGLDLQQNSWALSKAGDESHPPPDRMYLRKRRGANPSPIPPLRSDNECCRYNGENCNYADPCGEGETKRLREAF